MKKYLFFLIFAAFLQSASYADITYDTLNIMMPPSSRLGTGDNPEVHYEDIKAETKKDEIVVKTIENKDEAISFKDFNVKYLSDEISTEMQADSTKILSDLAILYEGAIKNSETIRYAIYKLSNPEENKPNESTIKKILKPVASFSSIAGTALSANPYMATGALIGGSLVGAMTSDDKEVNYKFTKVNDADMVVLVRKIDELQKKLLFTYMDYLTAKDLYEISLDNLENRKKMFDEMQKTGSREELIIADSYYRNAQELVSKQKAKFQLSRTILENLAGKETLQIVEEKDKKYKDSSEKKLNVN